MYQSGLFWGRRGKKFLRFCLGDTGAGSWVSNCVDMVCFDCRSSCDVISEFARGKLESPLLLQIIVSGGGIESKGA